MGLDLTGRGWQRRVIKNPLFPASLQWITLAVFVLLIVLGWNYHGIRGIDLPDPLAYTNLSTLFFWVLWLMGLVILVPFIGRLWCTVCPLGYLNDLLARFGWRLRYPRRLKNLYLAAFLLVLYNGLVAFFKISRYPDYSARLLLGIVVFVVAAGLLFRGRIFCGYLCPVGAMVGVYSRTSPWRLDVRDREVCRGCPSKACYLGEEKWYRLATPLFNLRFPFRRPGCQVDLFPPELAEDPRCVMCTQCIKNCPYDNIRWGSRPFLAGLVTPGVPDRSEAFFVVFLMGATFSIFTRVWPTLNSLLAVPGVRLATLAGVLGAPAGDIVQMVWSYALLPLLFVLALSALAAFLAGSRIDPVPVPLPEEGRGAISFGLPAREEQRERETAGWQATKLGLWGIFGAFTPSFIPLILSAHAAFAMVKLNEKIAYLPGALRDPTGVKFYLAIHQLGFMAAPRELISLGLLRWLVLLMVIGGATASIHAVARLAAAVYAREDSHRRWGRVVFAGANAILGAVLATLVIKWLF